MVTGVPQNLTTEGVHRCGFRNFRKRDPSYRSWNKMLHSCTI